MKRICSWLLTLALVLGLCACGQSAEAEWQEQYDLGVRYLSEGNYEEAIIAFTAAIEIDPKRPEGYTGRGDAYALSGDTAENLDAALADYEAALELDETLPLGLPALPAGGQKQHTGQNQRCRSSHLFSPLYRASSAGQSGQLS